MSKFEPLSEFEPLNEFEQFAETRRLDANDLLWQVPGLSMAAQSFLIGAALSDNVDKGLRVGVSALAAFLALATIQLLMRHRYRARLFSNGLDASREAREASALDNPDLFERIAEMRPGEQGDRFRKQRGSRQHPQHWPAFITWTVLLSAFVLFDVVLAFTAILAG